MEILNWGKLKGQDAMGRVDYYYEWCCFNLNTNNSGTFKKGSILTLKVIVKD